MHPLSLTTAPDALRADAAQRWTTAPDTDPAPGQLWLLSWDGAAPVAALLTAVRSNYVLAMPVTFDPAAASDGEALIDAERLGTALVIWYRLETGLGSFLLHRYIGDVATADDVTALRRGHRGEKVTRYDSGVDNDTTTLRELVNTFARLCNTEWPSEADGDAVVDAEALKAVGITPRLFAERTGLPTATALALWTNEITLTGEQARIVTDAFAGTVEHALSAPNDWITNSLADPRVKDGVLQVAEHTSSGERAARDLVRSSFALAARTPSVAEQRRSAIRDAIALLLQD